MIRPFWLTRLTYWARPYDTHRDARCWRWRRTVCRPLLLADDGTWREGRWGR